VKFDAEDQLRCVIGNLCLPPTLDLALQRLEVPLNTVHANRERVNQVETLVCLASTGVNTPGTMLAKFLRVVESC